MLSALIKLPRLGKKLFLLVIDFFILYGAIWLAFFIRLEEWWPKELTESWKVLCLAPLAAIPTFISLGLYNAVIRYLAPRFAVTILKAVTAATIYLGAAVVMGHVTGFPRSVLVLYWMITVVMIGGTRLLAREFLSIPMESDHGKKLVAIYGAGAAGTQICKALQSSPEYQPVAFFDDSREIQGMEILGCRVHSPRDLERLIGTYRIEEVILSMPSAPKDRQREIIEDLQAYKILVKTLPGIPEMVSGEIKIDQIREVQIEDLLGRDPVKPVSSLLRSNIYGKCVLVSGAGGSIGSELCRQIAQQQPSSLILLEMSEFSLYQIERELRLDYPELRLIPVLGSITNRDRVRQVMANYGVHTVYHAAAYKHVPMVESNLMEGVANNIFGTLALAEVAVDCQVETFILISTDKAVRPTNVMGSTKRFAELILQGLSKKAKHTRFTMVRFGNVLGSSGSVVPLFREQIRNGGPVTVTHEEMTRYFMTIPEASQLVIQAGAMGQGGDVFVLDMGEPVKIYDLATKMIHLSGLSVCHGDGKGDIAIKIMGLRPGEKLYEELLIGDNVFPTEHPRIMRAEEISLEWDEIQSFLSDFSKAIELSDSTKVRDLFEKANIGYSRQSDIEDVAVGEKARLEIPLQN